MYVHIYIELWLLIKMFSRATKKNEDQIWGIENVEIEIFF
jgi:hypothetical protein